MDNLFRFLLQTLLLCGLSVGLSLQNTSIYLTLITSFVPECVARVPVSLWEFVRVEGVFARRRAPRRKQFLFGGFMALRDLPTCFIPCRNPFYVTGTILCAALWTCPPVCVSRIASSGLRQVVTTQKKYVAKVESYQMC